MNNQTGNNLIYVLEDDEWYRKMLVHNIMLNPELEVESFEDAESFISAIGKRKPFMVTLDYRIPGTDCETVIKQLRNIDESIRIIIISEQEDVATAINLLKIGAQDYIVKDTNIKELLHRSINLILENKRLKEQINVLKKEVQQRYNFSTTILGESDSIKAIHELINRALNVNINVVVTGETGTGKEVVARVIHFNSDRKNQPFVPVNMSAIPTELIESELFGHEKGAFTGAVARRKGKFEEANNGTIFLDEIGEMELHLQAKLLRVLQEMELTRVGGNSPVKLNLRIIVATNRDLEEQVRKGAFRSDLYYRLIGIPIHLPPLRDRGNDVLILAKHFIDQFCKENKMPAKKLLPDAEKKLMTYKWPGNIRELKASMELAVVMSDAHSISAENIRLKSIEGHLGNLTDESMSLRQYNGRIVRHFMKQFDNNTKKVAEQLDIGQTTVYRILKETEPASES